MYLICAVVHLNMCLIPTSLFKITPRAFKAPGPGAEGRTGRAGLWGGQPLLCCLPALPSPCCSHSPGASTGVMAPSPVPAGQRGRQPEARWNKQAGRKLLAGDQFSPHCSCSRRSRGHPAWVAGLSWQDRRSFATGLSLAMGRGEPRASLPLHGAFAHSPLGLQLVRGKTQSLPVLLVLDEGPGFGVTRVVSTSRMIPELFVLAQVYKCWAGPQQAAICFPKSLSSLGRQLCLPCHQLSLWGLLKSISRAPSQEHVTSSKTAACEERSWCRERRSRYARKGTRDCVWEVKPQLRVGRRATIPKGVLLEGKTTPSMAVWSRERPACWSVELCTGYRYLLAECRYQPFGSGLEGDSALIGNYSWLA